MQTKQKPHTEIVALKHTLSICMQTSHVSAERICRQDEPNDVNKPVSRSRRSPDADVQMRNNRNKVHVHSYLPIFCTLTCRSRNVGEKKNKKTERSSTSSSVEFSGGVERCHGNVQVFMFFSVNSVRLSVRTASDQRPTRPAVPGFLGDPLSWWSAQASGGAPGSPPLPPTRPAAQ